MCTHKDKRLFGKQRELVVIFCSSVVILRKNSIFFYLRTNKNKVTFIQQFSTSV